MTLSSQCKVLAIAPQDFVDNLFEQSHDRPFVLRARTAQHQVELLRTLENRRDRVINEIRMHPRAAHEQTVQLRLDLADEARRRNTMWTRGASHERIPEQRIEPAFVTRVTHLLLSIVRAERAGILR